LDQNLDTLRSAFGEIKDLYDHAPCGYHSLDPTGLIIKINETELNWLGYSREEIEGRVRLWDLVTPQSKDTCTTYFADLQKYGSVKEVEIELFRKNGSVIPLLINAVALYDENGKFIQTRATVFDITERKRAEKKLEESEGRLLAFISNIPAVIFVKDTTGRYLFVNEEFQRVFGLEGGQILFRTDAEIFSAEQAESFKKNDELVIKTGKRIEFEETAIYTDGPRTSIVHKFPIRDDSGEIVALGGIATDITERQRISRALERVNRALRVLSGANEVIVHAETEESLYSSVCHVIVTRGSYRMAWIGLAQHDEEKLVRPVGHQGGDKDYLTSIRVTWDDSEHGMGPTGMAIKTGLCHVNQDVYTNPAMAPWRKEAISRGYISTIALPLQDASGTFGALNIYAGEANAFDDDEIELLRKLAADLSFGVEALRTREKRRRAEEAVHRLAYFDTLTGLPNRTQLLASLTNGIAESALKAQSLALLFFNIDHFTEFQDGLGVRQAEALLQKIALRLQSAAGSNFLARLDGDRFAMIHPNATADSISALAVRVHRAMEESIVQSDVRIDVRINLGAAMYPDHGADADSLLLRSDIACRRAKALGVSHMMYSGATDQESPHRLSLIADLRRAIQSDQLILHFQPKIDSRTGVISGAEALVRWSHPVRGLISPAEFIPLAEHTGLIAPLTDWVLRAAVRESAAWLAKGIAVPIAVNVSPQNLRDDDLIDRISTLLQEAGVPAENLQLEITETTLMEDPARSFELLSRLKKQGIRIFVDDFGTGYSSLSYIATLPLYSLKIDRSFVVKMTRSKEHRAIVAAAISLAHSLGLRVVAEGVDAVDQLADLKELGCDEIQGFLFSKPLSSKDFLSWSVDFSNTAVRR